ncbi:MAG TPA: phage capsid protein, partial [Myxococcales bacterium]|nr:phage capsid protein [Myxococcales bacterium]
GAFRSDAATSLDVWHLALDFASLPALNDTFIQDDPPISRVVATGVTEPQFLLDCYIDFKCARPMPTYGVPGFVDRF